MSGQERSEPQRLEINWVQASAGALAAVSSAVLLSTLGVAGTIIGAAAGSLIVTVGNSVYSHYLAASKERAASAAVVARGRATRARERTRGTGVSTGAPTLVPSRDRDLADAELRRAPAGQRPTWRELVGRLRWRRVAVAAAGVFALSMGAIFTFELITGHAVSTYTGGSDSDGPRTSFGGDAGPERTGPTESTPVEPTDTPSEPAPTEDESTTPGPEESTTAPTTPTEPTTAPPTESPPQTPPPTD